MIMKINELTISIVVYNNYEKAMNTVDSIEKYTNKSINKMLYIIDNTDLDNRSEKFVDYISKYDDVKYITSKDNIGFGKGHNLILDRIESKYHAIVNPDIELIEDSFKCIIDFLDANNGIGMCAPSLIGIDNVRQYSCRKEITLFDLFVRVFNGRLFKKRYNEHIMKDEDYSKVFDVSFVQGSFLVIRTELLKLLSGFDERYFMYMEDADLCKRVNEYSRLVYYPGTTVIHSWERGSHKNLKLALIHVKSIISYFNKWGIKWK